MNWRPTNTVGVVALIAIAIIFPLFGSASAVTVMALGGLYAIVAIGLNLLVGYTGKISFGHNAFMAMGAYASGILTVRYDWSPLSAMIAAAVSTGLVAFIIGAPILRVRGHYLAMITLAFSQVVIIVSTRWTEVTGGFTGLPGVPDFAILGFSFDTKLKMYYLIWCIAIELFLFSFRSWIPASAGPCVRSARTKPPRELWAWMSFAAGSRYSCSAPSTPRLRAASTRTS